MRSEEHTRSTGGSTITRIAGVGVLLAGIVLVAVILLGGDSGHKYKLLFETGGQLVPGNLVSVAGQTVGTVDEVRLTDDAQAEISITTDEPLHEGTRATIRATSLSGIANRYISLAPGPNSEPEIGDEGTIPADDTTSPVDIDQFFDTFNEPTRKALQDVIEGQATVYTGNNKEARQTYKYFAPGLQATERLLAELTDDQQAFSNFLAQGSRALGAIADRRDDLAALTSNANQALGAIAARNNELDRALAALPPFMRQGNTTFVNLRAALDDLDPLVADAKVVAPDLAPFLRQVRGVVEPGIPVFNDLAVALSKPGANNDLADALGAAPGAERAASQTVDPTITALDAARDNVALTRVYTPDILGLLSKFGQITAFYDANGHYARVLPTAANIFANAGGSLTPLAANQQFAPLQATGLGPFTPCPGAATQANPGWPNPTDHPFLGDGVAEGECDPDDVPPGP